MLLWRFCVYKNASVCRARSFLVWSRFWKVFFILFHMFFCFCFFIRLTVFQMMTGLRGAELRAGVQGDVEWNEKESWANSYCGFLVGFLRCFLPSFLRLLSRWPTVRTQLERWRCLNEPRATSRPSGGRCCQFSFLSIVWILEGPLLLLLLDSLRNG